MINAGLVEGDTWMSLINIYNVFCILVFTRWVDKCCLW